MVVFIHSMFVRLYSCKVPGILTHHRRSCPPSHNAANAQHAKEHEKNAEHAAANGPSQRSPRPGDKRVG